MEKTNNMCKIKIWDENICAVIFFALNVIGIQPSE